MTDRKELIYVVVPLAPGRFAVEVRRPDGSQWSEKNKWWLGRDYADAAAAKAAIDKTIAERAGFFAMWKPFVHPWRELDTATLVNLADVLHDDHTKSGLMILGGGPVAAVAAMLDGYPGDSVIEPGIDPTADDRLPTASRDRTTYPHPV
jgi:hypothetical protein